MNPVYNFIQRNRVLAKIEKAHSTKASNLILDDYDLQKIPTLLIKCEHVTYLNIGHNKISELPSDIGQLVNLQNLSLEHNAFDCFPPALKDLPNLTTLNLSHNSIRHLNGVGNLLNLETLWCNNCHLLSLPEEIGNLTKLDTLGARHNQLTKLPDGICNLIQLRWLTLEDNQLYTVPADFDKLQSLIHLNLNENHFNYIPAALSKLKQLCYLHLRLNQFYSVPESVLSTMLPVKINLLDNPLNLSSGIDEMFPNVITTNKQLEENTVESDSSSDWENSVGSSDLNYSSSESDSDDEDILCVVPKLSRYLVTF